MTKTTTLSLSLLMLILPAGCIHEVGPEEAFLTEEDAVQTVAQANTKQCTIKQETLDTDMFVKSDGTGRLHFYVTSRMTTQPGCEILLKSGHPAWLYPAMDPNNKMECNAGHSAEGGGVFQYNMRKTFSGSPNLTYIASQTVFCQCPDGRKGMRVFSWLSNVKTSKTGPAAPPVDSPFNVNPLVDAEVE